MSRKKKIYYIVDETGYVYNIRDNNKAAEEEVSRYYRSCSQHRFFIKEK